MAGIYTAAEYETLLEKRSHTPGSVFIFRGVVMVTITWPGDAVASLSVSYYFPCHTSRANHPIEMQQIKTHKTWFFPETPRLALHVGILGSDPREFFTIEATQS